MESIKILGESIRVDDDFLEVNKLKFLEENPRVYTCVHKEGIKFKNLSIKGKQNKIFQILKEENSVKTLIPEIERNGGIMEPIFVRLDTMEVVEGNSRLAAYRCLFEKTGKQDWEMIPAHLVQSLTDKQQMAYLNQIHVKGKTQWSAYEKANIAYVNKEKGMSTKEIANLLGETQKEIEKRISVIELMGKNKDIERDNFSYYDVIVRNKAISAEFGKCNQLKRRVLSDIKKADKNFTAIDLRDKLPTIFKKPKILKKYISNKEDLDSAYQSAKINRVVDKLKKIHDFLRDIESDEIKKMNRNDLNSSGNEMRKIRREVKRISSIFEVENQK